MRENSGNPRSEKRTAAPFFSQTAMGDFESSEYGQVRNRTEKRLWVGTGMASDLGWDKASLNVNGT